MGGVAKADGEAHLAGAGHVTLGPRCEVVPALLQLYKHTTKVGQGYSRYAEPEGHSLTVGQVGIPREDQTNYLLKELV